jgi:hypothetical protein
MYCTLDPEGRFLRNCSRMSLMAYKFNPCNPCCCRTGIGSICGNCDSVPVAWELTVSGITDGSCQGCSAFLNGTFALNRVETLPGTCRWDSSIAIHPCSPPGVPNPLQSWTLENTAGLGYWWLVTGFITFPHIARYRMRDCDFDCLGENVFPLFSVSGQCSNIPPTLTVMPA